MYQKYITICNPIDYILEGGVRVGELTEIYGESGVGKTQICLQLLLTCLLDPQDGGLYGSSIYVQACPVFPAERLYQISSHVVQNRLRGENPLTLVNVKKIHSAHEIFLVLSQVELMVLHALEGCRHTKVVVVDSIAYLFRHEHNNTAKGFNDRNRMLVAVANKLTALAKKYNIAVVLVNEVADVFTPSRSGTFTSGREVMASLGPKWESMIPNRMFISKQYNLCNDSWYREWLVVKSANRNLQGRRCAFRITANGVSGW